VEWSAANSVDVLERHPDGRPAVASWSESYGPIRDRFVLSYEWEGDSEVRWHLLEGRVLKKEDGRYRLAEAGGGVTSVELELTLGIGVWVIPILRTRLETMIVSRTLSALKHGAGGCPDCCGHSYTSASPVQDRSLLRRMGDPPHGAELSMPTRSRSKHPTEIAP